jgi:hypothetical protein
MTVNALLPVLCLIPVAVAGIAEQTDWSGGDSVWGPVSDWGSEFHTATEAVCFYSPGELSLLQMFMEPVEHTIDATFDPFFVYAEDVDGDGHLDVLGASLDHDRIVWWENDGSGTGWTEHTVDNDYWSATSVYAEDVDGDGHMDVLGAASSDDMITWWENVSGSGIAWTEHTVKYNFNIAYSVCAADVNGDGYMDVLGASGGDDTIAWWKNNDGSGTSWTEYTIDGGFNYPMCVRTADVDGDGDTDVLGAGYYADAITWWENVDGSGTSWTTHNIDADFDAACFVCAEDVNGDGHMDVLGAAILSGYIAWWENVDGSGISWTEHQIDNNTAAGSSVCAADVDADGHIDVLVAEEGGDAITLWANDDGSGTAWTEHVVDGFFDGAVSVCAGDVNGDGMTDVIGGAEDAGDVAWWEVSGFGQGSLESSVLDIGESPEWGNLDWTCTEPAGSSIAFQVRASDNSTTMGPWSDTLTSPSSLSGVISDGDSLFQYRAILIAEESDSTPILHDVSIDWELWTGVHGVTGPEDGFVFEGALSNPAVGTANLSFALPADSRVELEVYDVSGRVAYRVADEYAAGAHRVEVGGLASGMYIARISSGASVRTTRFVLMEE